MKVLILGVNGFIGSSLVWKILQETDWEVYGMDMGTNKLGHVMEHERFKFFEGDITINKEWIEYHVRKCDVLVPLVAIATPALYVKDPIRVYELDFEANMEIIRKAVKYKKRLVFPSTSEVYGLVQDAEFDEYQTNMVYGPIPKQRWIYATIKQLLDRVIWGYGETEGLDFSLFRPFNFVGPKLDDVNDPKEGSSRVVTQFIHNIITGKPIKLVDGGAQKRSFTFIDDGVDCIMRIIGNENGCASGRIFNVGNPKMQYSIKELAEMLVELVGEYPDYADMAKNVVIEEVTSEDYYGSAYQDVVHRVPKVEEAKQHLGWEPTTDLRTALKFTLDYHLANTDYELNAMDVR
ncbi:bifunctional UDP-4-keto-pentose/UDP-xylose synthase [Rubellicoccus peritrichatus]|uniref:Bifunctional UDP-4-keto-pentose/UDP-xylose synthase n=1 Tax=Rubellicoccus peritrichatus TaxID=3080537 RepID=A0AAQ3L6Z6_9BACT|nr:bifunctional UDP-4-keto-pentose/UDP-xylose synthase [Puniceicoccus sp. CR14]WOO40694.1 bifunctional UDP-4-keto-pentose/UDP-xylose synthase [Puniceicoccus sp. CR14]